MRILLVEDDIPLAEVLYEMLTNRQYLVDLAQDGIAAWNWVELIQYNLIVLDVTLPKLNGIQFCQRLRHVEPNSPAYQNGTVPVLMLTARDTVADKIF
jgi:DNA-binding response OmpR family regulator